MALDIDLSKTLQSGAQRFELRVRWSSQSARVVIYGPSGSGKSMLLRMIAGLLRPDHGHIHLAGRTLYDSAAGIDVPAQQRHLGYVFQDYALFPHLSVRQNIAFGMQRGWLNPRARQPCAQADRWIDTLGLRAQQHQLPQDISGGQRQRTALARALAPQPRALLLDEPFSALDAALRVHLRSELDTLQRALDIPVLLITHDAEDLRAFGGDVLHLQHGSVAESPSAP